MLQLGDARPSHLAIQSLEDVPEPHFGIEFKLHSHCKGPKWSSTAPPEVLGGHGRGHSVHPGGQSQRGRQPTDGRRLKSRLK